MQLRDQHRLEHIFDYCVEIERTVARFGRDYETFRCDKDYHDVVAFRILQIGELVGELSPELRAATSNQIEWRKIKGMRNIVAHDYGNIDIEVVWQAATLDIPALKAFCEQQLLLEGTSDGAR